MWIRKGEYYSVSDCDFYDEDTSPKALQEWCYKTVHCKNCKMLSYIPPLIHYQVGDFMVLNIGVVLFNERKRQ